MQLSFGNSGAALYMEDAAESLLGRHVTLKIREGRFSILQQMRVVVKDTVSNSGGHSSSVELAHGVFVDRLMLAMHSPNIFRPGGIELQSKSVQLGDVSVEAATALAAFVHTGIVHLGEDKLTFFDLFKLADMLDLPELYQTCAEAALSRTRSISLQLSKDREERLLDRLKGMYQCYPGKIPVGHFDIKFVGELESSTIAQSHRLVLAAVSGYFRALSRQYDAVEPWQIKVADFDNSLLHHVLEFAYTGSTRIPSASFSQVAFQADGWQFCELTKACIDAIIDSEALAHQILNESDSLPGALMVAVAISIGGTGILRDNTPLFMKFISNPIIACHLAVSFLWKEFEPLTSKPPPIADSEPLFDWREFAQCNTRPDFGRGKGGMGRYAGREPLGTALENFIASKHFTEFLHHPESKMLPLWSTVMVLESLFIWHHLCETSWPSLHDVVGWVTEWAVAQNPNDLEPDLPGVLPAVHHLVRVRKLICQVRSSRFWRKFWQEAFTWVMVDDVTAVYAIVGSAENHIQLGYNIDALCPRKGRGKVDRSLEVEVQKRRRMHAWSNTHAVYEMAFVVGASRLLNEFTAGQVWPWSGIETADFVRLLACEVLDFNDFDPSPMRQCLRAWLEGGSGADERANDLAIHLGGLDHVLRYPLRSSKAPSKLRNTVSRAEVMRRVGLAIDVSSALEWNPSPAELLSALKHFARS